MEKSDYYFDVIDGKISVDLPFFEDRLEKPKEVSVLEYAFEQLEEIADASCIDKLLAYIAGSIHEYSEKKILSLGVLGYIADDKSEVQIIKYMGSNNYDLSFAAFCSVCIMAQRNVLSKRALSDILEYINTMLVNRTGSNEEVLESLITLKKINHENLNGIINKAILDYHEITDEIKNIDGYL